MSSTISSKRKKSHSTASPIHPPLSDPSSPIKTENLIAAEPPQKTQKIDSGNEHSNPNHAKLTPLAVDLSRIPESGLPSNLIEPPTDRPVRIYCDGIWDLFHFGYTIDFFHWITAFSLKI